MKLEINDLESMLKTVIDCYNEIWKDTSKWQTNLDKAELLLEKLLSEHPNDSLVLTNLGAILSDKGQHHKALKYLLRAASQDSDDRSLFMNIGIAKMNISEERASTQAYFDKARGLKPNPLTIEAYFDPHGH